MARDAAARRRADTRALQSAELGTVKWFNEARGYGWIERDGAGADVFVHFTAIEGDGFKTLQDGDRVELEVEDGSPGKGPRASRVRVVERSA